MELCYNCNRARSRGGGKGAITKPKIWILTPYIALTVATVTADMVDDQS